MGPYAVCPKQVLSLTLPGAPPLAPSSLPTPDSRLSPLPSPLSPPPITLDADVYYPDGPGPFPVLLMRQPYGRSIASTVVYAHPTWYASHGYIVVIQDVRGRGSSSGDFRLFEHEAEDGAATVEWVANLPKSSGEVGMYGFSYQGMTQLYAATHRPEPLKVLAPAMVGYDLYADWAYENGALLLQAGLGWAFQLAAETARRSGDAAAYQALYQAGHHLPLDGPVPADPALLHDLAPDSFFHDWRNHPHPDAYWQSLQPDLTGVDLPMLHIGGWFDPYLRGTLRLYQHMQAQGNAQQNAHQHLWIGPWGHLPWSRRVGMRDFGPAAENPVDRLQLRWFNQFLKGRDEGFGQTASVRLFDMGTNRWQDWPHWPQPAPTPYLLTSTGLAGMRPDDGHLWPDAAPLDPGYDVIVHDPWRPVPSLGGHSGVPSGSFDRAAIDGRSDVLTYSTPPLTAPLQVAGTPSLTLYLTADAPSVDISAVLSEVYPDGRVFNLTQGYGRFDLSDLPAPLGSKAPHPVTLPLQPTHFTLPQGHALRLSLATAAFPAYPVNSGTGANGNPVPQIDHRLITLALWHGQGTASCLHLPIGPVVP
ncbi:CocE/NonD family hydrolase [Phormidium sp. FACHB-1136]|uniref:CocE/NonD family hydrolase n=1 Tax=Phormidium sp. FACHB-1136 TaxID=2692848 RepID=UPI0016889C2C|nr:CocE/NonD family hydrolase [Phormidium sp. FACHB-1136]MBD2424398.1 CocE/NonD family hydrolase [Phormidium sp. FACHB-1136]